MSERVKWDLNIFFRKNSLFLRLCVISVLVLVNDVRLCSKINTLSPPPNATLHNTNDSLAPLNVSPFKKRRRKKRATQSVPLGDIFSEKYFLLISMHNNNGKLCSHSPCKFCSSSAFNSACFFFYSDSGRPINNHPTAMLSSIMVKTCPTPFRNHLRMSFNLN